MSANRPPDPSSEVSILHTRLKEAEAALQAKRVDCVDALAVSDDDGEKVCALRDAEQTYRRMVEGVSEGLITLTRDGIILYCNRGFAAMLKVPVEQIVGRLLQTFVAPSYFATVDKLLQQGGKSKVEIWLRDANDGLMPIFLSANLFPIKDEPSLIYMVATDLAFFEADVEHCSNRTQYEARLEYQANYDALTGLENRGRLHDRLQQLIVTADHHQHQVAVAFIGLDQFKFINDSMGHHSGDHLLQTVAERLRSCLRKGDMMARNGGDEFIVVLNHSDEALISLLMPKLLASIAEPSVVNGRELLITGSIGVSLYPIDGADASTLLKNAGIAMSRAKEQGRNNIQFYTVELNQKISKRLALESMLRRALERGEFFLLYQPQVSMQTGCIVGVEALIRWTHQTAGVISPVDFIPLAEELGLIVPIGEWVLRTACAQNKAWQDADLPKIMMSVNLSGLQFKQKNLVNVVAQVLMETGLDAKYLDLELTESTVMDSVELTVTTLRKLKSMGLKLSIDDFGTGYSSLSYLKRFPIDVLKIDQSFVRDITTDPDDAAIAVAIISLAHSLKLKVIAEGVESAAQLSYLRRHQCDGMQGYFFSRPVPADALIELLRQGKQLPQPDSAGLPQKSLLIIDDDPIVVDLLAGLLRKDGYRILTALTSTDGFELLALHQVQVIICDQRMPVMSGIEFLSRVKDLYPDTIRIVLSGDTDLPSMIEAVNGGVISRFFTKPWTGDVLRKRIGEAFHQHWLTHGSIVSRQVDAE
ncbi:MAG: EAL domain-containing protein [Undibacterium sp.]|uniref:EAL domain-containing protein n=1 Tax=Undibacterium sp. TaxID=1914977 RepID=UPI00271983C1|nr:EAL domain-containing protein [Undibacterium sp.]MDO8652223.1 EAL domain-containing protein [Undibacterium sp.]